VTRWIFVRHGESTANAQRFLSGWHDVPLTQRGMDQAVAAAHQIQDEPIAAAVSSDLDRARHTGELLLETWATINDRQPPTLSLHPELRERRLGKAQGMPIDQVREMGLMKHLLGWDTRPSGGESHLDLALRALPFLIRTSRETTGPVLVASHGGMIRTIIGLVDRRPTQKIGEWKIPNATPIVRQVPTERWEELLQDISSPEGV